MEIRKNLSQVWSRALRVFCSSLTPLLVCVLSALLGGDAAAQITNKGQYVCGFQGGAWKPGRQVNGGRFLSHADEISASLKQLKGAKGKKKKSLQNKIKDLSKKIAQRAASCDALEAPNTSPAHTPNPGQSEQPRSNPEPVRTATPIPAPPEEPVARPIRFDLSGAQALLLADSTQQSSAFRYSDRLTGAAATGHSNLRKLLPGGVLAEALASGVANVSRFIVGPNNKVYVLFGEMVCLEPIPGGCAQECLLAEVSTSNGAVSCIDSTLTEISWDYDTSSGIQSHKPIQFDGVGNLYYSGYANGAKRLRRYDPISKRTTDLLNRHMAIHHFLVLFDGSVLLAGSTPSTNAEWLLKRRVNGSMVNISDHSPNWMAIFPDGRVYFDGRERMNQSAEAFDPINWIGGYVLCGGSYGLCDRSAMLHTTPSGTVFAVNGWAPELTVAELYPHPHVISTSVTRVTGVRPVLNDLLVMGRDAQKKGALIIYDTEDGSELDLLDSKDIEVYHAEFNQGENSVQFDGLDYSDGNYVLCSYNLSRRALSCIATGAAPIVDFQNIGTPGVTPPPAPGTPAPLQLVSYDLAGAAVVIGDNGGAKVLSNGEVVPLQPQTEGRRFRGVLFTDNRGNLWVRDEPYFTDADTTPCNLARVDRVTGEPTCVLTGKDSLQKLLTNSAGQTFILSYDNTSTYKLSLLDRGTTNLLMNIGLINHGLAMTMSSDGGVVVMKESWNSLGWLKKFSPTGEVLTHLENQNLYGAWLGTMPDGRIAFKDYGIRTLSADGTTLNTRKYVGYAYGEEAPEATCTASWSTCNGDYLLSLEAFGSTGATFSYYSGTIARFTSTLLSEVTLSERFNQVSSAAVSRDGASLFVAGKTTSGSQKIIGYNVAAGTERDLTDVNNIPQVNAMAHKNGALYILVGSEYESEEDNALLIKDLAGGTTVIPLEGYHNQIFALE